MVGQASLELRVDKKEKGSGVLAHSALNEAESKISVSVKSAWATQSGFQVSWGWSETLSKKQTNTKNRGKDGTPFGLAYLPVSILYTLLSINTRKYQQILIPKAEFTASLGYIASWRQTQAT